MGAISFSLDPGLVACLKEVLPLSVLVETGTFEGETAWQMAQSFAEIHTVELSDEYYGLARSRLEKFPSVHVHHGASGSFLRSMNPLLEKRSVLYWLDAHWCRADATAGMGSQCPLLEELNAIGCLNEDSVILIDDARLFLAPPPAPHYAADWPRFDAVVRGLLTMSSRHELLILNDVILYVPACAREALASHARDHGVDWLLIANESREYHKLLKHTRERERILAEEIGKLEARMLRNRIGRVLRKLDALWPGAGSKRRQVAGLDTAKSENATAVSPAPPSERSAA